MKIVVIAVLIAIVVALFTALVFLYRDAASRQARRVGAGGARRRCRSRLVAFLLVSYYMGWIGPGGMR